MHDAPSNITANRLVWAFYFEHMCTNDLKSQEFTSKFHFEGPLER